MPSGRGVQPESEYQWITLDDFTAGIYYYTSVPTSLDGATVPGSGKTPADPSWTFQCIALPSGGLGPMPGAVEMYEWTADTYGSENWLTGFLAHNELAGSGGETEEFFLCMEGDDGTNHYFNAYSYDAINEVFNSVVSTTNGSAPGIFGSPYPAFTRVAATDPTTTPGNPTIAFPIGGPAVSDPDTGQLYIYPDPSTPTAYSALGLIASPGDSVSGQVVCYENRILALAGVTYEYPAGGGFDTNEQLNFTDPPNSDSFGFQQTVLSAEDPFGYGAAGSISAGELFLVKKRAGGVQLTGDLLTPTALFLPGVTPTGGIFGRGASTLAGFVYCSYNNGAWLWNGANTSQKISQQLDDSFFLPSDFETMASNNYGFFVEGVGDKIYFNNNWVYDTRTSSWWRYYAPTANGGQDLYYVNVSSGPDIYAAVLNITTAANNIFAYRFNQNTPATDWQWQSLPIKLTDNRLVEAREIVVRASNNQGNNSQSQVIVYIIAQDSIIASVTTPLGAIWDYPTMIRMPIGGYNTGGLPYQNEDLTIRIGAYGGTGPAPNVHSVGIGFNQRQHAPTTGVSS